ncbi:MAG: calcium-binding protein, partial [Saccharothrix sp.]|nr:calcium-binding protein [Saccharothrix sp.]
MSDIRRTLVPALLATAGMMFWPTGTAAAQPQQTCNGLAATHVGTAGDDVLFGTNGADVFVTLAGDDVVFGLNGNDTVCLGA